MLDRQNILPLIGRAEALFWEDLTRHENLLKDKICSSRILVVGGAGSIGSAVVRELFARAPRVLHVVDLSENNLVELVRDLRSSIGYTTGDFRTFCLDVLGPEYLSLMQAMRNEVGGYDYVLNFSALKHVRSEKDPYTLMRLIDVNIFATLRILREAKLAGASKFFCVSTDKAANPVNMMGASKRIMECFLASEGDDPCVSTARFANVAFSDGSLPHGWTQRLLKRQPLVAPKDVKRYFLTDAEGAALCLFSIFLGRHGETFFPKLSPRLHLISFAEMARQFLRAKGIEPVEVASENEARKKVEQFAARGAWPCFFPRADTTGEKSFEEFYTSSEQIDWDRYHDIAVIERPIEADPQALADFRTGFRELRDRGHWNKQEVLNLFYRVLPDFRHIETGRYLDGKM
jgi:FlaA1/EpsC-like NDP-sugar epimerase